MRLWLASNWCWRQVVPAEAALQRPLAGPLHAWLAVAEESEDKPCPPGRVESTLFQGSFQGWRSVSETTVGWGDALRTLGREAMHEVADRAFGQVQSGGDVSSGLALLVACEDGLANRLRNRTRHEDPPGLGESGERTYAAPTQRQ